MLDELNKASLATAIVAVVFVTVLIGLLAAVTLKFVGESVFRHKVAFFDALKACLSATFVLAAVYVAFVRLGLLSDETTSGIAIQVVGLLSGVVVLAFTISVFVRGPDGKRPEFAQSGVAAAIVQVVLLVMQIAVTAFGTPFGNGG